MIREQCKLKTLKYNQESQDSKVNGIIILSSLGLRIKSDFEGFSWNIERFSLVKWDFT